MRPNDVEARLEDMTALGTAASPDELHRALMLRPPAAFEREHSVPLNYFVRAHERGPAAAVTTAMLLVTDPRWVPVAQRLMRAIAATGIVSDDDLDLLAEVFVVAGPQVYWACPDGWLDGPRVVIDFDDGPTPISVDGTSTEDDHPPTVVARAVPGGARRWAAEYMIRRTPERWAQLRNRARELAGQNGGYVLRGLLDAVDVLPRATARGLREEALRSGRAEVRLAALQLLAAEDVETARVRASRDPSQNVRRWGAQLRAPSDRVERVADIGPPPGQAATGRPDRHQATLF